MPRHTYELGQANLRTTMGGRNNKAVEKPHDFTKAWGMILGYCRRYWLLLAGGVICTLGGAIFSLFGPGKLSTMTDMIAAGMDAGSLNGEAVMDVGVGLMGLYVISFTLTYMQNFTLVTLSQKVGHRMRQDIAHKLRRIPLSRFDASSFGDLLSRTTNDVDTISDAFRQALGEIVSAAALLVGCTVLMARTDLPLTAVALAASLTGFLSMNVIIRRSQPYFNGTSRDLGRINGHIEEVYAGHIIVKAYNGETQARRTFDEINASLFGNSWKSQFYSGVMGPMMELAGNIGYLAVCVVGAIRVSQGLISFGTIVAFIVFVKLFTQPLSQVAQAITGVQSAASAAERVFAFLDEAEMSSEAGQRDDFMPTRGHVVFDHVRFGYVPGHTIIHDFSVDIAPGSKVAIVGPTGAGKTTIVNLLMRFYELDGGRITVDGQDIAGLTRANVHRMFGMVLQDTWLFEDTLRANIVYSKPDVTQQQVEDACRAVGLERFVASLPKGYDTVLTDDSNLSAGQRQLLTIARAMVDDRPLLILDEATSSVDTHTEQLVQQAMDRLTAGRTSFTIAHRLSTIRHADVILVIRDGDIVEKGTHDQLLAAGGFYAQLWQSQFVNAQEI